VDAAVVRRDGAIGEDGEDLRARLLEGRAEVNEDGRGDAVLGAEQPEKDVLGADVVVPELE
jgi:hypothetical protein